MIDLPTVAARALEMATAQAPQWGRMDPEHLGAELELAAIMPGNTRADYIRAAALALHLAGRAG